MSRRITIRNNYFFYIIAWLFLGHICGLLLSVLLFNQINPYYYKQLNKITQEIGEIERGDCIFIQSCFFYRMKEWMLLILFSGLASYFIMYFIYFFFKGAMGGMLLGILLQNFGIKGIGFGLVFYFPQEIFYLFIEVVTVLFMIARKNEKCKVTWKRCSMMGGISIGIFISLLCILLGAYLEGTVNTSLIKWFIQQYNM